MGGGLSMNPKPEPDDGYNVSVDAHALPWTFQGESDADTVIMSRRAGSIGLSGDKKGTARRGVGGGGAKWSKAKYAVKGAHAFGQAGSSLAARKNEARADGTNGWIATHCVLGPRSHRGIEKFDLMRVIGRGVMGEVSLARFRKDGKYMAIKAISKGYVVKHDDERHVQNERLILGQLRHPFVVGLFGTLQNKQKIYFVLEYVAGGELFSKLRGNRCLSAAVAKFYLVEILAALTHVHAGGFVYRDLKPENVLLDTEGHCRLVDFGFACAPPDGPEGRMRTNCGTPAYLSPEQLSRKKTGGYTRIVDWWAFGCVAYELMSGHTPFCPHHRTDDLLSIVLNGSAPSQAKITRQIRIMRSIFESSKGASHSRLLWDPRRAP